MMLSGGSPAKAGLWCGAALVAVSAAIAGVSDQWEPEAVKAHMEKLAQWQLAHPKKHSKIDWTYGAFYAGMAAYGQMVPQGIGFESIREVGREHDWGHGKRLMHADDHCIGMAYIEVGIHDGNHAAVEKTKRNLDEVIKLCDTKDILEFGQKGFHNRWGWVDALFMSPPVFTKLHGYTGDKRYLEFMDREFKVTYDYLYDPVEDLFYRDSRYFTQKTPTGQKMFWSRGNGWAFAALPIILADLPGNWKTRPFYEQLFVRMAKPVKKAQSGDGSWHPSLLDGKNPDIRDMSASMFMTYGLMWGVNNGYLPEKEYVPVIQKAWKSACECISDEGALGWVQPIADKPFEYTADSTEVYGSGAFLLAASEIYKYLVRKGHPNFKEISITNSRHVLQRRKEISIPMKDAAVSNPARLQVFDVRNGRILPHRVVDGAIIFHADMMAGVTRKFWIFEG